MAEAERPSTGCTASPYGDHDYSQPPHNTPDSPRESAGPGACQAWLVAHNTWCDGDRRYEIVIYQPGTHDWVRLFTCMACATVLRERHRRFGPGGTNGIARVRLTTSQGTI